MKKVQITGATLEEAIQNASIELKVVSNNVGYTLLQEGKKGIFGFGSRKYVIDAFELKKEVSQPDIKNEVLKKNDETINEENLDEAICIEEVKYVINEIAKSMKVQIQINTQLIDNDHIKLDISGSDLGVMVGKDGSTMDSIQYLVSRVASKYNNRYVRIKLDVDGYREKRKNNLINMAEESANVAVKNSEAVKMKEMNAYERRIVHAALQGDKRVRTSSTGSDPYRYVVVSPVR